MCCWYLHQKLTTSLGGGSTSFFIFLPILEKKKKQKYDLYIINWYIFHDLSYLCSQEERHFFFTFYQLKHAVDVGITAYAQNIMDVPVGNIDFQGTFGKIAEHWCY